MSNRVKKRWLRGISLICMLAFCIPLFPSAFVSAATSALITTASNLYTEAREDSDVITTLSRGTVVTVLDKQEAFTKVKLANDKTGYCQTGNLDFEGVMESGHLYTGTTTTTLNVRSGPGTAYKILTTLSSGATVEVLDISRPDWVRVRLQNGAVGYCSKEYMEIKKASPSGEEPVTYNGTAKYPAAVRSGPGAAFQAVAHLKTGDTFTVTNNQNPQWSEVKLNDGTTGYCSKAFILESIPEVPDDPDDTEGADVILPLGQTLYYSGEINCKTSDPQIAIVYDELPNSNGSGSYQAPGFFIEGKTCGKVTITSTGKSSGKSYTRVVAVVKPDPVKVAYTSPNSAAKGSEVSLIAVTDQLRTAVKFEVNINGSVRTVEAGNPVAEGDTYVWTGKIQVDSEGTFDVTAYSKTNSGWETCDNAKTDLYVTASTDLVTTTLEERRVSESGIEFIGTCEGCIPFVYADTLAGNIPTVGYGKVITNGGTFYNNLTSRECKAELIQSVNQDNYATQVNKFLLDNNIKFNQQQFDALVSCAYNLGAYWLTKYDIGDVLKSAYVPGSSSEEILIGTVKGIDSGSSLNIRSGPGTSYNVIGQLHNGDRVTILSNSGNGLWFKIRTTGGLEGYCSSTYLNVTTESSTGGSRDLNYVSYNGIVREISALHHAGGVCVTGLYTRRLDELEIFFNGEYNREYNYSSHNHPKFELPSCLIGKV